MLAMMISLSVATIPTVMLYNFLSIDLNVYRSILLGFNLLAIAVFLYLATLHLLGRFNLYAAFTAHNCLLKEISTKEEKNNLKYANIYPAIILVNLFALKAEFIYSSQITIQSASRDLINLSGIFIAFYLPIRYEFMKRFKLIDKNKENLHGLNS